jgi:hypothetical protein
MSGVCVSIDYEGTSWEEEYKPPTLDMYCPLIGDARKGVNNFLISSCCQKVQNRELKGCYGGCSHARSIPEVQKVISKFLEDRLSREEVVALRDKSHTYIRGAISNRIKNVYQKKMLPIKERKIIISYYVQKKTMIATMKKIGCGRTAVSFYRKMYREGIMDLKGELING